MIEFLLPIIKESTPKKQSYYSTAISTKMSLDRQMYPFRERARARAPARTTRIRLRKATS